MQPWTAAYRYGAMAQGGTMFRATSVQVLVQHIGAALYLGLVSSEKVEPGTANCEEEVVVIGAAIVVGAVVMAVPVIGAT